MKRGQGSWSGLIYASRNMMNSIKNFKGVRHNMDEFDGSDNGYLNAQYMLFRKRLVELYHSMSRILGMEDKEGQYRSLLTSFVADRRGRQPVYQKHPECGGRTKNTGNGNRLPVAGEPLVYPVMPDADIRHERLAAFPGTKDQRD
jgi:hypothetical protein